MTQQDLIVFDWSNTKNGKKPNCWIVKRPKYVTRIIRILEAIDNEVEYKKQIGTYKNRYTGCTFAELVNRSGFTKCTIKNVLFVLLGLRLVNLREHGRAKIFRLTRKGRDYLYQVKMGV